MSRPIREHAIELASCDKHNRLAHLRRIPNIDGDRKCRLYSFSSEVGYDPGCI